MECNLNVLKLNIIFVLFSFFIASGQIKVKPPESFGDQLVIGFVGKEPQVFNPYQINSMPEKFITRLIFGSGLIQSSDRFEHTNSLVDLIRYESLSDKKQELIRIFRLKRNIYFHNGLPLRNSDVKFTFENLSKWGGNLLNHKFNFSNIEAIEIEGDLEFKFVLKRKDNLLEEKLSDIPILSKNYYENMSDIGFDIFKRLRPVGSGPFLFEMVNQSVVSLLSFNNYVFDQPFLNRIKIQFFGDEKQMIDSFIQGKVDFIEVQTLITARRLHQILQNEIMIFTTLRPEKKIYFILFNVNKPPFNEKKVRFAIKGAIDKTGLVKDLVPQNAHEAYSVIDATNSNFFKPIINDYYKPEESLRILRSNGWQINQLKGTIEKNGKELRFNLLFEDHSELEEGIARTVKIQLAELGVNVQPKPVSFVEKQKLIEENNYTAVIQNYSYYEENIYSIIKDFYFSVLKNAKFSLNYTNPTIEYLFEQPKTSAQERKAYMNRFQIILHQDAPAVFMYFDDKIIYAVNSRFQNFRIRKSSDNSYFHRLVPFENWFVPKPLQKYEW